LIFESEVVFDYEADWFVDGGIFEDEIPKILGFRLHDRNDKKVRAIDKAWQLLKPECQAALRLYYEEEKSYKDMAEEMNILIGTVGRKLFDCKGYFKTAYTKIFNKLK
jgi:DNA-directed RNA polymerase specialized sigma24 family protein